MTFLLLLLLVLGLALCATGLHHLRSGAGRRDDLVPLATVWQISDR